MLDLDLDLDLDLVLTYGIEIEHSKFSPQSLLLSDHYLQTYEFLFNYKPRVISYYSRCIAEDNVENFKDIISSAIKSILLPKLTEESYLSFSPSLLDPLTNFTVGSLCASLDSIAPVKNKTNPVKALAPGYYLSTQKLKQKIQNLKRNCVPLNWKSHAWPDRIALKYTGRPFAKQERLLFSIDRGKQE